MSTVTGRPSADTEPVIFNVVLVQNVENSQALPEGVHKFTMRVRKNADDTYPDVCFAFETLQVPPAPAGTYAMLQDGAPYGEDNLHTQLEIFLSTAEAAGAIVEIIAWV